MLGSDHNLRQVGIGPRSSERILHRYVGPEAEPDRAYPRTGLSPFQLLQLKVDSNAHLLVKVLLCLLYAVEISALENLSLFKIIISLDNCLMDFF